MLCASIQTVVEHRRVDLLPLSKALAGFSALAQTRWAGWRRRHQLKSELPVDFDEILTRIFEFADPAITGGAIPMTWDSAALRWYGAGERSDRRPVHEALERIEAVGESARRAGPAHHLGVHPPV